jgi:hypothetical protein
MSASQPPLEPPDGAVLRLPGGGAGWGRIGGRWVSLEGCTGIAARWCPIHGGCTCPEGYDADLDYYGCPLHSEKSSHAEELSDD